MTYRKISLLFLLLITIMLKGKDLETVQREFTDLRFGAFIHFGIRTFTGGEWAEANQDISQFNPDSLNCNQWAEAVSAANMKFGILTTKHHDGFCLWDSDFTDYDIANTPYKSGEGDVVQEYVDAFRAHGLEPCLYYSIWDNTTGIGNASITTDDMNVIKGQITEILSNYGEIKLLFIDGWSWKMGHKSVPYDEIRVLVKELQPNCLLVDNTHLECLYNNDMLHYEAGGSTPINNRFPALYSLLINTNGGNGWFWNPEVPTANLLSVNQLVNNTLNMLEPQWVTFVLNIPPNNKGLLDNNIVNRLQEVGEAWEPDLTRSPLPQQQPQVIEPITPVKANASSGNADAVIDGLNDRYYYSVWESSGSLPQTVIIDLGEPYDSVSILTYVPKYVPYIDPKTEGSIKKFKIYKSMDDVEFEEICSGEWNGDEHMKIALFKPVTTRYIVFEILSGVNNSAAVTEFAIGRGDYYDPTFIQQINSGSLSENIRLFHYPNPAQLIATIFYEIPDFTNVQLIIYDNRGRKLKTLINENKSPGQHGYNIDISEFDNGIYIYELITDGVKKKTNYMLINK